MGELPDGELNRSDRNTFSQQWCDKNAFERPFDKACIRKFRFMLRGQFVDVHGLLSTIARPPGILALRPMTLSRNGTGP